MARLENFIFKKKYMPIYEAGFLWYLKVITTAMEGYTVKFTKMWTLPLKIAFNTLLCNWLDFGIIAVIH